MVRFLRESEFKKTEVGEIPKDWEIGILRDAVKSLESGNRPKGGKLQHDPNGVLSIGGENITWEGELILNNCLRFNEDFYKTLKKGKIECDDILLVKDGATIGKLAYIKEIPEGKAMVNEHVFLIKTDERKYNPKFLFYYLFSESGQIQIESSITGSAQGGLNRGILDIIKIPILDPLEQSHIAQVLSWFDDLIENKKKQNEILEKTAMAIFKSWFIDFEPFKNEKFIDSELGKIPEGWKTKAIGEIAEFTKGLSYKGSEKFYERPRTEQEFVFITLDNVLRGGGFKIEYTWIVSKRIRKHQFLREGDLIIANTDMTQEAKVIGSPAIVIFPIDYNKEFGVYSHHITKITPNTEVYKLYLYVFFKLTQDENTTFSTGTNVLGLDIENFKRNKFILLPPPPILQKFRSLVKPLFQKIILNQKQIMLLRKIRDTLLPLLVFGKLRVREI